MKVIIETSGVEVCVCVGGGGGGGVTSYIWHSMDVRAE